MIAKPPDLDAKVAILVRMLGEQYDSERAYAGITRCAARAEAYRRALVIIDSLWGEGPGASEDAIARLRERAAR